VPSIKCVSRSRYPVAECRSNSRLFQRSDSAAPEPRLVVPVQFFTFGLLHQAVVLPSRSRDLALLERIGTTLVNSHHDGIVYMERSE
jgi:hypothetical protein